MNRKDLLILYAGLAAQEGGFLGYLFHQAGDMSMKRKAYDRTRHTLEEVRKELGSEVPEEIIRFLSALDKAIENIDTQAK